MRTTERLIDILESVNATAIDNDDGKPGEHLAEVCREAAQRLRALQQLGADLVMELAEALEAVAGVDDYVAQPARADAFGGDEIST